MHHGNIRQLPMVILGTLIVFGSLFVTVERSNALDVFDNQTPPASPPWMARPCKTTMTGVPREANCYYNPHMGLTTATGEVSDIGFWIRKIPGQHLTCWLFSADSKSEQPYTNWHWDECYGSAENHRNLKALALGRNPFDSSH